MHENSIFGAQFLITNLESVLAKFGMHQMTLQALLLMDLPIQTTELVLQIDLV